MRSRDKTNVNEPLDPIAMTLAIWLGLVVGVTGLVHLSEDAAHRAALAQTLAQFSAGPPIATPADDFQLFNPRVMAFGG